MVIDSWVNRPYLGVFHHLQKYTDARAGAEMEASQFFTKPAKAM
jgi:hypothetical protein|tara:strand:+ start:551 stop:682 length:132 start_codon:yes stop_codon:yes gene_type:complete